MTDQPAGMLLVIVDVDPEHEDEFNRWYDEEHIPEKRATAGFRSARRFASADQPGRYLAVYEIDHADVVTSADYMTQMLSERTRRVMATWRAMDRSVWSELPRSPGSEGGTP